MARGAADARHFHWCLGNHDEKGRTTYHDPVAIVTGQMIDQGHRVTADDTILVRPPAINLLFEGFTPGYVDLMRKLKADEQYRFGIILGERPGRGRFNDTNKVPWMKDRYEAFPDAAEVSDFVWCLVPGAAAWARQWCRYTADFETGWSAAAERRWRSMRWNPPYLFGHFGGVTGRRAEVIEEFRRRGLYVHMPPEQYGSLERRDAELDLWRVTLGMRNFENWLIVSGARYAMSLLRGRPVISEEIPILSRWRRVVPFVPDHQFIDRAVKMANRWRAAYEDQMARFRRVLGPDMVLGKALAETQVLERFAA